MEGNDMRRTLIALASAGALAAGTAALPSQANALPVWVVPAIIGAGVAGVVIGAAHPSPAFGYGAPLDNPPSAVYAGQYPYGANCRIMREKVPGGWHRVTVCG
jgi:hypothetical protein